MKYINNENGEVMDRDEAIDWIIKKGKINFEFTTDIKEIEMQTEIEEVLLEAYFYTESEEDMEQYEDDLKEREKEYREGQGF